MRLEGAEEREAAAPVEQTTEKKGEAPASENAGTALRGTRPRAASSKRQRKRKEFVICGFEYVVGDAGDKGQHHLACHSRFLLRDILAGAAVLLGLILDDSLVGWGDGLGQRAGNEDGGL